jgi:hypothetical protein
MRNKPKRLSLTVPSTPKTFKNELDRVDYFTKNQYTPSNGIRERINDVQKMQLRESLGDPQALIFQIQQERRDRARPKSVAKDRKTDQVDDPQPHLYEWLLGK